MAHNLARWTARTGLGEQVVTTKTPPAAVLLPRRTNHPLGPPPHPASSPELALGNPIQSRPGPTASHSTPGLTAPSATELPTAQPKVPANSRHPGPREFPAVYSLTIPRIAVPADGHRDPVRQLKTVRRPPIYPNGAQAISPAAPSPPFRCPHAVHRWIRAKGGHDAEQRASPHVCPACRRLSDLLGKQLLRTGHATGGRAVGVHQQCGRTHLRSPAGRIGGLLGV